METRSRAALFAALFLLFLLLIQPNHPQAMTLGALKRFPLELPVITLLLMLVPVRSGFSRALRTALMLVLGALFFLRLGDLGTFIAFNRRFNLVYDSNLFAAGWHLLSGTVGKPLAALAIGLGSAVIAGLFWAIWWAVTEISRWQPAGWRRGLTGALLVPATALAVMNFTRSGPFDPPGFTFTSSVAYDYVVQARKARANIAALRIEVARDPVADIPPDEVYAALADTDVLLTFVESYGRSTHDNPLYAPTIRPRLEEIEADLATRGLAMRSGWMTAPMVGGQSWLAHGSVLSGLWVENQGRYDAMLQSKRRTLLHLAQRSGHHTVAVMPAISMAWPEGLYFGYDQILAAGNLGYKGLPFNWVTMPDQYTLSALERLVLDQPDRAPVFAEIALISSHAPWTPVPELIEWESVGDGTVFNEIAVSGDSPDEIWRDKDRVRDQFRQATDYTLQTIGSFAARHADNPPLMIVLGDHQPATFVSQDDQNRDVPIHIIGSPELIARLDSWGWTNGMLPASDLTPWPMNEFRANFVRAFSGSDTMQHAAQAVDR